MPNDAWISLGHPKVKEAEDFLDRESTEAGKDARILQLKKQRRRAIRRCIALQGCMERLLRVAARGTEEEILKVVEDCHFVMKIPFQNALLGEKNVDSGPEDR